MSPRVWLYIDAIINKPFTNETQISTNRGRSIHFQPQGNSADSSSLTPLPIAAGTILTGFYASQVSDPLMNSSSLAYRVRFIKHPEEGLVSLGAISEPIQ